MDAVAMYQEGNCDSFVSIGGGSSHDACKGARVSVAHDGRNVNEFEGFNMSENPKNPPHIAVSTTAGTGSETSWAYVITDTTTDPGQPAQVRRVRRRVGHHARDRRPGASTSTARSTTRRSAASTSWPTPASRTCRG